MQLVSKKNFLMFLAAVLVVALGYMALTLTKRPSQKTATQAEKEIQQIKQQSESDDLQDIEKDLNDTDLIDIDKDLQNIESEIEPTTL